MKLILYNTLTRKKEEFVPHENTKVRLYTCGPTVYDYAHIGNLRAYIFSDILRRTLAYNGYTVNHIENITDVGHLVSDADEGEDKMMKALKREGLALSLESIRSLAKKYADAFQYDVKLLNILAPKKWVWVTEYIQEIIQFIQKIVDAGYSYKTGLALYFDVSKIPDYTKLSGQKLEDNIVGAREDVEIDREKKNPADFALWFMLAGKNKNHVMRWPSPWGEGFPGWHIECSAISIGELGPDIDIHTGGTDHIPVHHTNERAQNFAVFKKEVVWRWMHNEFLVMGEKMSKSSGNYLTLQGIMEKGYTALSYRYLCLNTHYRQKLQFSWEGLNAAENALKNLQQELSRLNSPKIGCAGYEERFLEAMNDDLNTPKALGILWELVKDPEMPSAGKKQTLLKFDAILGLGLEKIGKQVIPKEVQDLAFDRERAREKKDWKKSDKIRDEIRCMGFEIEDTADGPKISLR